jgi:hypothetical protein
VAHLRWCPWAPQILISISVSRVVEDHLLGTRPSVIKHWNTDRIHFLPEEATTINKRIYASPESADSYYSEIGILVHTTHCHKGIISMEFAPSSSDHRIAFSFECRPAEPYKTADPTISMWDDDRKKCTALIKIGHGIQSPDHDLFHMAVVPGTKEIIACREEHLLVLDLFDYSNGNNNYSSGSRKRKRRMNGIDYKEDSVVDNNGTKRSLTLLSTLTSTFGQKVKNGSINIIR